MTPVAAVAAVAVAIVAVVVLVALWLSPWPGPSWSSLPSLNCPPNGNGLCRSAFSFTHAYRPGTLSLVLAGLAGSGWQAGLLVSELLSLACCRGPILWGWRVTTSYASTLARQTQPPLARHTCPPSPGQRNWNPAAGTPWQCARNRLLDTLRLGRWYLKFGGGGDHPSIDGDPSHDNQESCSDLNHLQRSRQRP